MTPPTRPPTFDELREFLRIDGWKPVRTTSHDHFEKTLDDKTHLATHVSHSGGSTVPPGRFALILRDQLKITRAEFWEALRTGNPVARPAPVEDVPIAEHNPNYRRVLRRELHMSEDEIQCSLARGS